jgi:hypothetical protein
MPHKAPFSDVIIGSKVLILHCGSLNWDDGSSNFFPASHGKTQMGNQLLIERRRADWLDPWSGVFTGVSGKDCAMKALLCRKCE